MFEYYTILLIVTTSLVLSALVIIYNDNVLSKFNRDIFVISHIVLLISYGFEWIALYLSKTNSSMHALTTLATGMVLFAAPSMMVILAWGINDTKSKLLSNIVLTVMILNFMIGFSGLFCNAVFYYDDQSIYHRGDFFFLHFIMVIISALTLFINTFRLGLKYQNKNNYILILDLTLFLVGLLTHFSFDGIYILWLSILIALGIFYIYYSSFANQVDILTRTLNRKCFDSQLYDIKSNAIILFFDVNKFKEINDTHGHSAGDYCLIEIAKAIKEVYGKSGYCYRLGGDEFSVILNKNLDSIEELNEKFRNLISEKKYTLALPTVSIGHSYYYPNKTSIQKVIEEADAMMYQLKQQTDIIS